MRTAGLCLEAVKSDSRAFEHVPENLKTLELCLEVAQRNGRLEHIPPEFIGEIKRRVFMLEDIVRLDDACVAKGLQSLGNGKTLALALCLTGIEVWEKVRKNMPEREAAKLLTEMEYMGPIRLKDAEDAASKVCAVFHELEKKG